MFVNIKKNIINKKKWFDKNLKYISIFFTALISLLFISMLGFIIYKSVDAFSIYGIQNILFTNQFDFNGDKVSFWIPFSITLLTTFIAIIIAAPLGIKTAIFIKFRIKKQYKKFFKLLFETLAGIPSVIFGLFASQSFGQIIKITFNLESSYSIINSSIMLSFMILPTIIALSYNSLDNVDMNLLTNPIAIGTTKTRAIYKVYTKAAKSGIVVSVILAIGRSIGEAMAVSMILQSQNYSILENGLGNVLASDLKTISSIISYNMFADNASDTQKSLLFAFGLLLFIIIGIINLLILELTKKKRRNRKNKFLKFFYWPIEQLKYLINYFWIFWEFILFRKYTKNKINNVDDAVNYSKIRIEKYKLKSFYSFYKQFWEWFSVFVCFAFLGWLIVDILYNGSIAVSSNYQSVFSYSRNTTGQAFFNTLLIIIVAIGISLPISLIIAIYFSEYSKSKKIMKMNNFLLDALGSTPSILFGLFGLILFIQVLGWTENGVKGNSLIAGALTISIVILPSFIRSIQEALLNVPLDVKKSAYALGSNKYEVIKKIVIPFALVGITTSIILSISRIFAESAPLYLTAGLSASNFSVLNRPGQTLTTRIFNQLTNSNITEAKMIMYECAFVLIFLVLSLVITAYLIIPNWKKIKKFIYKEFNFIKYKLINIRKK